MPEKTKTRTLCIIGLIAGLLMLIGSYHACDQARTVEMPMTAWWGILGACGFMAGIGLFIVAVIVSIETLVGRNKE